VHVSPFGDVQHVVHAYERHASFVTHHARLFLQPRDGEVHVAHAVEVDAVLWESLLFGHRHASRRIGVLESRRHHMP
jgi:hypothetical protein